MTTNISKLIEIPDLEATVLRSGIALGAAYKHRLSVSDFAIGCEVNINDANTLIDFLVEQKYVERYVFRGENWVRSLVKVSNKNK